MCNYCITKYFRYILIIIGLTLILFGCNKQQNRDSKAEEMNDGNLTISGATRQSIIKIKDRRILFAHHSVGENIIDGLQMIAKESGVDFKVDSINVTPLTNKNKFVDLIPGKNQYPKTKVDGFVQQIKNLNEEYVPEVAFMKFCFVDFGPDTDVEDLLKYYKKNIEALKKEKPDITFAHLTVPLVSRPENIKSKAKRLLGRPVWEDASNVTRAKFNELLLKTFPKDPIFDIARIESTRMDGSRAEFLYGGKVYYSLVPEYTDDGSHLNALGRRVAASEMAEFLANTLSTDSKE